MTIIQLHTDDFNIVSLWWFELSFMTNFNLHEPERKHHVL